MKTPVICLLLQTLLTGVLCSPAVGQHTDKLIFGGLNVVKGTGRYNAIDYGAGLSVHYQYPLTDKVAVIAKVGLDLYRVSNFLLVPTSYLGYGYNPISGFGFNTLYYNFYGYETKATAISVPVQFGPRLFVNDQIHADFNVGVDIAANRYATSVLRVEPGVGYMFPLNGGFLDITAGYFTSFARGSGTFTVSVAYGLKLNR